MSGRRNPFMHLKTDYLATLMEFNMGRTPVKLWKGNLINHHTLSFLVWLMHWQLKILHMKWTLSEGMILAGVASVGTCEAHLMSHFCHAHLWWAGSAPTDKLNEWGTKPKPKPTSWLSKTSEGCFWVESQASMCSYLSLSRHHLGLDASIGFQSQALNTSFHTYIHRCAGAFGSSNIQHVTHIHSKKQNRIEVNAGNN